MIYLDSSVALAQLFAEDRQPPEDLWQGLLTASRLRGHSRRLERLHEEVRAMLDVVTFVELTPVVLSRALEPVPHPVLTPDALHLATIDFRRNQGQFIELATYDTRLRRGTCPSDPNSSPVASGEARRTGDAIIRRADAAMSFIRISRGGLR